MSDPRYVTAATLLVERASADAVEALRGAGIRSILIKGPLQQQWLSAAGPSRVSADVDLLVDSADVDAAGRVLSAAGYRLEPEVTPGVETHAHLWTADFRVPIEVHWTLWTADPERTWRVLTAETEPAEALDVAVEIPNEAARCLIVALHAAQHGEWANAPLGDLERAVSVAPLGVWERAAALARDLHSEAVFATGLSLLPSGQRLRDELGLSAQPISERLAMNLSEPVTGAAGFYWLGQQRGMGAKARFIVRKVFPPADFMRFKYRFARKGRVRLALAYLYRPLWIAGRAVPGFLSWWRSRQVARRSRRAQR